MKQKDIEYLIHLSLGGFYKKKLFRKEFLKYVISGEDLFQFLHETRKKRRFGQTIKKSVLNWIYSHTPSFVERELCKSYKLFDGLTVLKLFHPKPINIHYDRAFKAIKQHCLETRRR